MISGFIICKNEQQNIAKAILSIKDLVEDLYVIDSGSSDKTCEIAESLGAKVIFNEWRGYKLQKVFGESLTKNDWIINLDADEEFSDELRKKVRGIFQNGWQNEYHAYMTDVVIIHRFDSSPRKFAPSNRVVRLYNKQYASFNSNNFNTHDSVEAFDKNNFRTFTLTEPIFHRSGTSIEQLVYKANFYSSEQSKEIDKKISNIRLMMELPISFFKAFFLRRYFVFGINGFVDSLIFTFGRFLKLAKIREKNVSSRK